MTKNKKMAKKAEKKKKKATSFESLYKGRLDITRSGMGYVIVDKMDNDIMVRPNDFNTALHGDTVKVNGIINKILDSMVMVCHLSIDGSDPQGASNVNPANLPASPSTFEGIINHVFADSGIATLPGNHYFCNPYTVDYPKPYGKNPPLLVTGRGSVDTCNCRQFAMLKTAAHTAGFDTSSR